MARFVCDGCGFDGRRVWAGAHACPACGETVRLQIAVAIEEITEAKIGEIERAWPS